MKDALRILIITHGIAPDKIGGSETQTLGLATELAKSHYVTVILRSSPAAPKHEWRNGFLIRRLGLRHRLPFPVFSFFIPVLWQAYKNRKNIDIIFAKETLHGFIAAVIKKICRIPAVFIIEGVQEYRDTGHLSRFLLKYSTKYIPVIVQTPQIQKELEKITGIQAWVVPNGVELNPGRVDGDKVIFVGRLIRGKMSDKGVRYLIEAVTGLDIDTLIIGDGPERMTLQNQAAGEKTITFIGIIPPNDVPNKLKQGLVLVLPSVCGEGLPNVILESFAAGVPVIAARTAGIPDVIQHGKTGFLVEPKNAHQIRHYIQLLRNNPELRKKMKENCYQEAKKYAWKTIVEKFEQCFRDVLEGPKSKTRKNMIR